MKATLFVSGVLYRVTGPNGFDQLIGSTSSFGALVRGTQIYLGVAK